MLRTFDALGAFGTLDALGAFGTLDTLGTLAGGGKFKVGWDQNFANYMGDPLRKDTKADVRNNGVM